MPKNLPHQPFSITSAAHPYIGNVRDKFPLAPQDLINRLGEANWQRHEDLRAGDKILPIPFEAPKSVFQPLSHFKDSALGSSLPHTTSNKEMTVASHSSFLSTNDEGEKKRLRIPRMPVADWEESFTCPFCKKRIEIRDRVAWKCVPWDSPMSYTNNQGFTYTRISKHTFVPRKVALVR
jgi:hypothetical protein